jgi:cytochrome c oxidase cbb3-type subunit 4
MDMHSLSGVVTGVLLVMFIGLVFWAWDHRRKADFEQAARLPFADDEEKS